MSEQSTYEANVQQAINNLNREECIILSARPVSGGKVQLEFAEIIPSLTSNSSSPILGELNKSDERFTGRSARRAWISVEPEDTKKEFPAIADKIDQAIENNEKVFVGYKNPQMFGMPLHIQINEDHTPANEWEEDNLERSAKQDGNENYLLKQGKLIFSHTDVVAGEVDHQAVQHDSTTTDPWSADYDSPQQSEVEDSTQTEIVEDHQEEEETTAEVEA